MYLEPGLTFALSGVQLSINASDTYVILTSEGEGATIDAGGLSRAIEVSNGARLKMRGVHVTAGTTRPTHRPGDNIDGGCLLIRGALSHVSLSHMRMSGCSAPMGGAIAAMGGSAELTGVNITGSRATGPMLAGGGALLVSDGGFATLTDTAIVDAEANGQTAMGGAVLVQSGAKAVLHATHLEQCVASAQLNALGGAVAVRGGELVIAQGSSILRASCTQSHPHNSMRRAGGGVYVEGASAHIADTTIREVSVSGQRWANEQGAAVAVQSGSAQLERTSITECTSMGNWGCGAIFAQSGVLSVRDSSITNSTTGGFSWAYGACVSAGMGSEAQVTLVSTTLTNCYAFANRASYGGGVGMHTFRGSLAMHGCVVQNATAAGPVPRVPGYHESVDGGGLHLDGQRGYAVCTVTDTKFVDCHASGPLPRGGGISIWNILKATLERVQIINASLSGDEGAMGGGIRIAGGTSQVSELVIIGATTRASTTANALGGGIMMDAGEAVISRSTVEHCESGGRGGGLFVDGGELQLRNGTVLRDNRAPVGSTLATQGGLAFYRLPAPPGSL